VHTSPSERKFAIHDEYLLDISIQQNSVGISAVMLVVHVFFSRSGINADDAPWGSRPHYNSMKTTSSAKLEVRNISQRHLREEKRTTVHTTAAAPAREVEAVV